MYVFFLSFSFFFTHYILDIGVRNTNNYQRGSVRATADGGAELAGDPKLNIFTE